MYYYNSRVGLMNIFFDRSVGKYALQIGNVVYEHHDSAQSAADNVYLHTTGCYEWDKLDGMVLNVPTDLSVWSKD